jgi:hypothetical protein
MSTAKARCMRALAMDEHRPADVRLIDYYDTDSNHPGASFVELDPSHPMDVTSTDLLAVSMLGILTPPTAIRRLLSHGGHRLDVLNALKSVQDQELYMADDQTLVHMESLADAVLRSVRDSASDEVEARAFALALSARKRPDLFPLADPGTSAFLGLGTSPDHRITWQVMRYVLGDREVLTAIDRLEGAVESETSGRVTVEFSRLRLLLVTVATYASDGVLSLDADPAR